MPAECDICQYRPYKRSPLEPVTQKPTTHRHILTELPSQEIRNITFVTATEITLQATLSGIQVHLGPPLPFIRIARTSFSQCNFDLPRELQGRRPVYAHISRAQERWEIGPTGRYLLVTVLDP